MLTISQVQDGFGRCCGVAVEHQSGRLHGDAAACDRPPGGGDDEDNLQFTVSYVVTDDDGDTATGSLSIDVDDDTPTVASNLTVFTDDETATTPDAAPNLGGTDDYDGVTPGRPI